MHNPSTLKTLVVLRHHTTWRCGTLQKAIIKHLMRNKDKMTVGSILADAESGKLCYVENPSGFCKIDVDRAEIIDAIHRLSVRGIVDFKMASQVKDLKT